MSDKVIKYIIIILAILCLASLIIGIYFDIGCCFTLGLTVGLCVLGFAFGFYLNTKDSIRYKQDE